MYGRKNQSSRVIARTLMCSGALMLAACGGTMPFEGNVNVAGDPPPLPRPKPEPKPEKPKRVEVTEDAIEIHEKIHFEKGKAVIMDESFSLMDEIAQVFKDNTFIKKVRIEGHTDSDGSDEYNRKLSDDRAHSVMKYLADKGIEDSRMEAKGFGESKPIVENDSPENMAKNRRVEFNIVEQDERKKMIEVDPKTGKPLKPAKVSKPKK